MRAKFEHRALSDTAHISVCRYLNLRNLPHWHMEHELVYVYRGSAEIMLDGRTYMLDGGGCVFVPSESVHCIVADSESIIGVIKADARLVDEVIGERRLVSPVLTHDCGFEDAYTALARELSTPDEYSMSAADSIFSLLLTKIFRAEQVCIADAVSDKVDKRYKKLLGHIGEHFASVTFDEAAGLMHFNPTYFSKYFKSRAGMTFTEYINYLKTDEAVRLIHEGELKMTEISRACGFSTIRSFNRVFRAHTGYCPTELPEDYIFAHIKQDSDGFDPTVGTTTVLP